MEKTITIACNFLCEIMREPKFIPREGQIDYTHIRYAPVINCVLRYGQKILIVQRSAGMRLYPNLWNGISGFLDDDRNIEEKVKEELREELGITEEAIVSMTLGNVFLQDAPQYKKTWIVHPIVVDVSMQAVTLDWEARDFKWIMLEQARNFDLMPGFNLVLERLFNKDENSWSLSREDRKTNRLI